MSDAGGSNDKIRVVVMGAAGRMGATVCRAVLDAPDMELVAAVDPPHEGRPLDDFGVTGTGLTIEMIGPQVKKAVPQVAVDFTNLDGVRANARWCAFNGVHAVVGTTGLTPDDMQDLAGLFNGERANAVVAPNFAIGAVLMMQLAAIAAPWFESAEIIELHHDNKVDAPSGTAMLTAQRIAETSAEWPPDPTSKHTLQGARGGEGPGRDPHPLRPAPGARGPSGGAARHDRPVAHDPARLLRPDLVHAGCAAGGPRGGEAPRPHHRARQPARALDAEDLGSSAGAASSSWA